MHATSSRRARSVVRTALAALVTTTALAGLVLGAAQPAAAHPFGAPQSITLSLADPDTVRIHWQVGAQDDLTYLAEYLDLLPDDRIMLDGAVTYDDGDPALLESSPAFRAYLLDHLGVTVGGTTCPGTIVDEKDVLHDGATLDFACGAPVTSATVSVSMLTDLSSLYTTLATGPHGQRGAYGGARTSQEWSFGSDAASASAGPATAPASAPAPAAASPGSSAAGAGRAAALAVGAAALLALAVAGVLLSRRRRREPEPAPEQPAPVCPRRSAAQPSTTSQNPRQGAQT
ncbi:hypothetical protein [Luteimicrobium subarcticum]|uniref:hypothetical protein n=1 Tax=Luteimicrobium subarcticum TaxID=620910 RepID=UPI000C2319A2|nr:hypothetical protein [Luteimicrobium subarcticum]